MRLPEGDPFLCPFSSYLCQYDFDNAFSAIRDQFKIRLIFHVPIPRIFFSRLTYLNPAVGARQMSGRIATVLDCDADGLSEAGSRLRAGQCVAFPTGTV